MSPVTAPLRLARRTSLMKASAVREILKVTERPDVLSFAGGLPAPELFPVEALAEAAARVLKDHGREALQYGTTEGVPALRAWLAAFLGSRGVAVPPERVLVTSGSQQGIDLACKVLLDPGDAIVVESPSYLAALQVFGGYEATVVPVASDDDGLVVDALEDVLRARRPKAIYLTATFQNPKGTTLSLPRRERLVALAAKHGVAIIEDEPYAELRYSGARLPTLAELGAAAGAQVIHLGTFSKVLSPGLRVAWATAPEPVLRALTVAKQAADLHTSTLVQRLVATLLETFDLEAHLAKLRAVYVERRDAMLSALERGFPKTARWTRPDGGLFLWCRLPDAVSADALLADALAEKVAFVPGRSFFAEPPEGEFIRLNFSNRPPEAIEGGVARLSRALERRMK